jgi:hypothetical protein
MTFNNHCGHASLRYSSEMLSHSVIISALKGGNNKCGQRRCVVLLDLVIVVKGFNDIYVAQINKNCHPERSRRISTLFCMPMLLLVLLMTAGGSWRRD